MGINRLFRALFKRGRVSQRVAGEQATVHIDGAPHLVVDWSEGGMRIENYDGAPPAGERFAFRFVLPLTSEDVFEFEAWAEVLEKSPRGVAARFLFIDDDLAERLRAVIRVLGTTEVTVPAGAVDYG